MSINDFFEITGFLFGIAGIWLTIKESIWCFPIGLVNVIISLFLFFYQKLYSDAFQQIVYIFLLAYGWYVWLNSKEISTKVAISHLSIRQIILLVVLNILFVILIGALLRKYTDASVPYWDTTATALSFTAQWMIAKKKIENWGLWMIVNILYIAIYFYKGLFLYVLLFAIYFFLAVKGRMDWRKKLYTINSFPFNAC